ncbi:MBL fold metallo-hydrolase [Thermoactinomyces daqus]|uniref:MBL fold metallo-hydrolase n=2 Tax=Thermoactinomyces daqus TaxID=1329516 RepID=A0A7W1XBF4_9BACL|nr:MBL fold metallo-hydrolase [Thermoactinomyces daqus]MBA4543504.1 MBL fold metallo-hydrolase [Thermoactinomyces daqus]
MIYELYPLRMSYSFFINNSYLIVEPESRQAIVIDPAWELNKITEQLERTKADLRAILLTHSHHDHVNLVPPLLERAQPDVFMSRAEIEVSGFRCPQLHALEDGDRLSLRQMELHCLLTPGHTAGSMCFWLEDSLFTGDTLFAEGCGACHLPGGSAEDLYVSIQKLKAAISDHVRIYPGHSFGQPPGQTMKHLREHNIYLQLNRKHVISFRMRKNQKGLFDFR